MVLCGVGAARDVVYLFPTIVLTTLATGINSGGQIVGAGASNGLLYSGGIFTTIDYLGTNDSAAVDGISNSGQIVLDFLGTDGSRRRCHETW
jgi:hypothetical protein